ncbi:hypothetical protein [Sorangium sp. So ce1024]|uniref:hypothetical protein n=1 Tax=Sorangium sp. So ce1024 TaxID=3133327 RepID=UPI003F104A22
MKPPPVLPALAARPILSAAAPRAQTREETIARLALLVGDRGEAQRAVELAERVGIEEAAASPVALASERVDAYVQTVFNIAARGEPLPTTTEELRGTAEARQRCAEDMMRALTGIR